MTLVQTPSTEIGQRDIAAAWLLGYSSENTRNAYRRDLFDFIRFLEASGVELLGANRVLIEAFARGLELRGYRPSSVSRKLAAVASFFEWCVVQEIVDRNPCAHVRRPRVDSLGAPGLTRDQLRSVLRRSKESGAQDHALVLLLAVTGLRIGSAVGINIADIGVERGYRVVRVRGKGGKVQLVPLAVPVAEAVDRLMKEREHGNERAHACGGRTDPGARKVEAPTQGAAPGWAASLGDCVPPAGRSEQGQEREGLRHGEPDAVVSPSRTTGALFLGPQGERLDRYSAFRTVKRLTGVSPHGLRASFVTLALELGAPLHEVQDACGHADSRTTEGYNRRRFSLERNPTFVVAEEVAG